MCFMLYVGTSKPLPRREWRRQDPGLSVESLTDRDAPIAANFSKPEVQYVGSTSGCGCDFPHAMYQNGGWPENGYVEGLEDANPEVTANDRGNREALVSLLRGAGDSVVELYGVLDGAYAEQPISREVISLDTILDPNFMFKERGFYEASVGGQEAEDTAASSAT